VHQGRPICCEIFVAASARRGWARRRIDQRVPRSGQPDVDDLPRATLKQAGGAMALRGLGPVRVRRAYSAR
jgi:hypothetical protein